MYQTQKSLFLFLGMLLSSFAFAANEPCIDTIIVTNPTCNLPNGRIEIVHQEYRNGGTFTWTAGLPDTNVVENLSAQLYMVNIAAIGINGDDCNVTGLQINLVDQSTSVPSISENVLVTEESCEDKKDGAIDITVSGGVGNISYEWSDGKNLEDPVNIASGVYSVTVTDSLGCKDTLENIPLNPPELITIEMESEIQIYKGGSRKLEVQLEGGLGYLQPTWTPSEGLSCSDCLNPVVSPESTTTYNLLITDDNGCEKTDKFTAVVNDSLPSPFIPNAFTPNGDGNNDEFKVYGSVIDWVDMRIFDRWGRLVGTIQEKDGTWNGQDLLGKPLPTGAYVYVLEFSYLPELGMELPAPVTGSVTLIRE